MFSSKIFNVIILSLVVLFINFNNKCVAAQGEPVPGAEILIEQEPNDVPIMNGTTNQNGESNSFITFKSTDKQKPNGIKVSFKFSEKILKGLASKFKRTEIAGIFNFNMVIKIGDKTYNKEFFKEVKKNQNPKSMLTESSGPFSQSLSNIEDNGRLVNQNGQIKIPVSVKLYFKGIK